MGDVNLVIVVLHHGFKRECVVKTASFSLHSVLVVTDVLTVSVPADAIGLTSFFVRVQDGLLPIVVRAIRFDQINDIELVLDVSAGI
jgi:hypothetical protein